MLNKQITKKKYFLKFSYNTIERVHKIIYKPFLNLKVAFQYLEKKSLVTTSETPCIR